MALGCYLILFHTLQNLRPDGPRGPLFRSMAYLGKVSYGLYVFHGFVLGAVSVLVLRIARPGNTGTLLDYAVIFGSATVSFCLTVFIAHVSYTHFESRFLRLKKRFTPLAAVPAA